VSRGVKPGEVKIWGSALEDLCGGVEVEVDFQVMWERN
jgi:hypothetical protein